MELFLKHLWDDLRIYMEWWKGLSQGGFLTALFCQGRVVWSGTLRMIQASYRRLYFKTCIFRLIAEAYKDFTIKNKQWIRSSPVLSFLAGCSFLRSTLVVHLSQAPERLRPESTWLATCQGRGSWSVEKFTMRFLQVFLFHSCRKWRKTQEQVNADFVQPWQPSELLKWPGLARYILVKDVHARSGFMGRSSEPAKVCDFVYLLKDPHCVQGLARETWNALDGMLDLCRLP